MTISTVDPRVDSPAIYAKHQEYLVKHAKPEMNAIVGRCDLRRTYATGQLSLIKQGGKLRLNSPESLDDVRVSGFQLKVTLSTWNKCQRSV